jgi:CheY-like chemotaxis protein
MNAARILVVDDNPTNLKLVSDLLECEGYEILKTVDAEEAERIIEQHRPALVLVDIALPGMDGLTLTRKLKAEDKTKDLVIVALTAFAMRGDEKKARDAGCDGYITKPINTRALPALVAGYLPRLKPKATKLSLKMLAVEDTPFEKEVTAGALPPNDS